MTLEELDRRLQYGPAMRWQRFVEAALLLCAFLFGDLRPALVVLVLTALQAISPRLAVIAVAVARLRPPPRARLSDLYFDFAGSRGACAISVVMQSLGLYLLFQGHRRTGFLVLSLPTASFLLSATVGFCAGCAFYVLGRELAIAVGVVKPGVEGFRDVDVVEETAGH